MASRYRWRQQLLGSLQGQLQLATYLVVFLGFTGASSVGLLIGQRNLIQNEVRILHGVCTLVLLPLLWTLWTQRRLLRPLPALVLAIFATVMVVVNSWITAMGMGVEFGWLDHLFLALSEVALTVFFLMAPETEPISET